MKAVRNARYFIGLRSRVFYAVRGIVGAFAEGAALIVHFDMFDPALLQNGACDALGKLIKTELFCGVDYVYKWIQHFVDKLSDVSHIDFRG